MLAAQQRFPHYRHEVPATGKSTAMVSWFKPHCPAAAATDTAASARDALLNQGLDLAMEWGSDWLKPIQERLAQRQPTLTAAERDEINAICQAAMRYGHQTVYALAEANGNNARREDFDAAMHSRYPWVDADNRARLFSQGMYYAWKNLGF